MSQVLRFFRLAVMLALLLCLGTVVAGAGLYAYLSPKLPETETLREIRLQTPLRVYSSDARLISEFGEKHRTPVRHAEVPERVVQAFLAAEDDRFYQHPGVDWQGLLRAVIHLVKTGNKGPGGSTITMQVARNFFLGREKTYLRKLNEILLALKIERDLSKDEILELYLNKIFFGHRAYGIGAAAQVYYGKTLAQLRLEQVAMIAGLPKAPSKFNPIVNPSRALARRNYVLGRMRELNFIDADEYQRALEMKVSAKLRGVRSETNAPYVAEMVRAAMEEKYGDKAYTEGYKVYTTVDSTRQEAANAALRNALIDYDRRHGYRGPEGKLTEQLGDQAAITAALEKVPRLGGLIPAVVNEVLEQSALVTVRGGATVELPWNGIQWARAYKNENRRGPKPKRASDVLAAGDLVRVQLQEEGWRLAQLPKIEGAFVAMDPEDGAIVALTGGFDFNKSKFNRVMQAERQPGSSFKPFIYSAAIEKGYTAASFINDAPVVFDDVSLEDAWRPVNYSRKFFGPTRLRVGFYKSRNLVSIRLLQAVGIEYALKHIKRFGFDTDRLPHNLSLALGSGVVKPVELARGYTTLANGGFLVSPYFIKRVVDGDETIFEAQPARACRHCEVSARPSSSDDNSVVPVSTVVSAARNSTHNGASPTSVPAGSPVQSDGSFAPLSVSPQNTYIMRSMMRDVVRLGTGRKALVLKRKDLAGKTGTTNNQHDAWFSGFMPGLVATAWVGFDKLKPLGRRETGGRAALPAWIEFMRVALDGKPNTFLQQPEGIVSVKIDPNTGKLAAAGDPDAVFEVFRTANAPSRGRGKAAQKPWDPERKSASTLGGVTQKLF